MVKLLFIIISLSFGIMFGKNDQIDNENVMKGNVETDSYKDSFSQKAMTYNWKIAELKGKVKSVETNKDGHTVTICFDQMGRISSCSWKSLWLYDEGISQNDLFPDEPCNPFRGIHFPRIKVNGSSEVPLWPLSDYAIDLSYLNPVLRTETHPKADIKFRLSSGTYYYSYNDKGLLDKIYGAQIDNPNRKILVYRFQYDSYNRLIKRYTQDSLPTMKIEYDDRFGVKNALFDVTFYSDKGVKTKSISWGNVVGVSGRTARAYSNTIKIEWIGGIEQVGSENRARHDYLLLLDDGSFKPKEVDIAHNHYFCFYNDAAQLTKVNYDSKVGGREEYLFFYNKYNDLRLIQVNRSKWNSSVCNKYYSIEYEYVYDSHGNWTEMCAYLILHGDIDVKELIPKSRYIRKIEYYE